MRETTKIAALYECLPRDDKLKGASNSITNKKHYLEDYASYNGFRNLQHFTDYGYIGTNFNCPGFSSLLEVIESGTVGAAIVKDMSRFGRNYLQIGFYTEMMFPKNGVRFIAINNNVDGSKPCDIGKIVSRAPTGGYTLYRQQRMDIYFNFVEDYMLRGEIILEEDRIAAIEQE